MCNPIFSFEKAKSIRLGSDEPTSLALSSHISFSNLTNNLAWRPKRRTRHRHLHMPTQKPNKTSTDAPCSNSHQAHRTAHTQLPPSSSTPPPSTHSKGTPLQSRSYHIDTARRIRSDQISREKPARRALIKFLPRAREKKAGFDVKSLHISRGLAKSGENSGRPCHRRLALCGRAARHVRYPVKSPGAAQPLHPGFGKLSPARLAKVKAEKGRTWIKWPNTPYYFLVKLAKSNLGKRCR